MKIELTIGDQRIIINLAKRGQRFANLITDIIFINLIFLATLKLFNEDQINFNNLRWIHLLIPFLYYLIFETLFSTTPGKVITKTQVVVNGNLSKPSFVTIFGRTLIRLTVIDLFTGFSKDSLCWHDRFSKTIVVQNKNLKSFQETIRTEQDKMQKKFN